MTPYSCRGGVNNFDSSLVDAWIFSGHTNAEAPASITGEKGMALTCRNFAWTEQSGFDGQGFLVFDGVDDFLLSTENYGKLRTVICSFYNLSAPNNDSMVLDCRDTVNSGGINVSYKAAGNNNSRNGIGGLGVYQYPFTEEEELKDVWVNEQGVCGNAYNVSSTTQIPDSIRKITVGTAFNTAIYRNCAVRFIALYSESLTDAQCRAQIAYITALWESRKNG